MDQLELLNNKVAELSRIASASATISATQRELLPELREELRSLEAKYLAELAECRSAARAEAEKAVRLEQQLEEMRQIANPEVKAPNAALKLAATATNVAPGGSDAQPSPRLLLSTQTWTLAQCHLFVHTVKTSLVSVTIGDPTPLALVATRQPEDPCETKRKELQEEFRKAYLATSQLLQDARSASLDQSCELAANTTFAEQRSVLDKKIAAAVAELDKAERSLQELTTMRKWSADALAAMAKHVDGLQQECDGTNATKDYLNTVDKVIKSIDDCPVNITMLRGTNLPPTAAPLATPPVTPVIPATGASSESRSITIREQSSSDEWWKNSKVVRDSTTTQAA